MIKKILRVILTILGGLLGYGLAALLFYLFEHTKQTAELELTLWVRIVIAAILVLVGAAAVFTISPKVLNSGKNVAKAIESSLRSVSVPDLLTGTAGLVIGLLIAFLISRIFTFMNTYVQLACSVLAYIFFGYLGIQIATRRGSDVIRQAVESRPKAEPKLSRRKNTELTAKIFDTSVIIDGRIADIMRTGFIEGPIVIPDFVLLELQHIADSSDAMKRQRGRCGLDIVKRIQDEYGVEIYNTEKEKGLAEIPEVDIKLLKLAQSINGKVVTNDYNLNKVAVITGVEVMNINDLANMLKPVVLPGEKMQVFIVKEGKEPGQGIAYLDDGTMIVIEDGRKAIGKTVNVTVTSVLQTSAGRMIFAKDR